MAAESEIITLNTTLINLNQLQNTTRTRSSTEPGTKRPEIYHTASYSADGSTHSSGTERDTLSSTGSPPKPCVATTSSSTRHKDERQNSRTARSPTVPIFHKTTNRDAKWDQKTNEHHPKTVPGALRRTPSNPSIIDGRSPTHRRAPASHSSYGIETSCGPPPSFSTQRTLSQDRLWKPTSPERPEIGSDVASPRVSRPAPPVKELQSVPEPLALNHVAMETPSIVNNTDHLEESVDEKNTSDSPVGDEQSKDSSSEDRKSEDLFLNIAKDSEKQETNPNDDRRSRASLPFFSNTRTIHDQKDEQRPVAEQAQVDTAMLSPLTEMPYSHKPRLSLGFQSSAASAHPLDEPRRQRYFSSAAKMTTGVQRSVVSKDDQEPERPKYIGRNTTESTISTTAPSTVWDELDDLKSRIKKLELTGKLPSSSAAAMSSATAIGERPRTATTNATTMSASPKHTKASISPTESAIDGVPSTVHPLLHEALSKAKPSVSQEVYQKLVATASDALQLAALMNGSCQSVSGAPVGLMSSTERQIRRRADSMCRGLTELAIALSTEPRPRSQPIRPQSRDAATTFSSPLTSHFASRRLSNDPDDRAVLAPRVHSRLESRRTSHLYNSSRTAYSSPETAVNATSALQPQSQPPPRVNRTSTLIRNRRTFGLLDGAGDSDDSSPIIRPPSRAMTDVGRSVSRRFSPRDQANASREYTSQRPMSTAYEEDPDDTQQLPPPVTFASGLVSRRVSGSPASVTGKSSAHGPVTPRERLGRRPGYGRESSLPLSSAENTPENVTIERGSGSRRSFGLASRIGSTVGSRLRAARAEKFGSGQKQQRLAHSEITELQQESDLLKTQVERDNASAHED